MKTTMFTIIEISKRRSHKRWSSIRFVWRREAVRLKREIVVWRWLMMVIVIVYTKDINREISKSLTKGTKAVLGGLFLNQISSLIEMKWDHENGACTAQVCKSYVTRWPVNPSDEETWKHTVTHRNILRIHFYVKF